MSNQIQLPSVDHARRTIHDRVHQRAFLSKMAELGYPVETEADARELLLLGQKVAMIDDQRLPPKTLEQPVKQAQTSKYATARMALDELLVPGSTEEEGIKQAAYQLACDPETYAAAFVLLRDAQQAPAAEGAQAAA